MLHFDVFVEANPRLVGGEAIDVANETDRLQVLLVRLFLLFQRAKAVNYDTCQLTRMRQSRQLSCLELRYQVKHLDFLLDPNANTCNDGEQDVDENDLK